MLLALTSAVLLTNVSRAEDQEKCDCSDTALLPTDVVGFASVRVADIVDKLGLNPHLNKASIAKELKEAFCVAPRDVERCSMALFDMKGNDAVVIVRLFKGKSWKIEDVQAELKKKFEATRVINDRTILVATNEATLKRCGKSAAKIPESEEDCAAALKVAEEHDFYAWGRFSVLPVDETLALPGGVESGCVMIDFGDKMTIGVKVACADDESAAWTKKALQTGMDFLRSQVLAATTMLGAAELVPGSSNDSDFKKMRFLPMKLIRQAEKGLQDAQLEVVDANVSLSIKIPVDCRVLRSEIAGLMRLVGDDDGQCFALPFMQTRTSGMTLPSGQYLEHAPQYVPPTGTAVPVMPVAAPVGYSPTPAPPLPPTSYASPPLPGTSVIGAGTGALIGGAIGYPVAVCQAPSPQACEVLPPPRPLPPSTSVGTLIAPVSTAVVEAHVIPATIKLTIANVRKETALLFKMQDGGALEFVQRLPQGEVVDVQTTTVQRWIAVFADQPAGESHVAAQADSVWLLRSPTPTPMPTPVPLQPAYPAPYPPMPFPPVYPPSPYQPGPPAPVQPAPTPTYSLGVQTVPNQSIYIYGLRRPDPAPPGVQTVPSQAYPTLSPAYPQTQPTPAPAYGPQSTLVPTVAPASPSQAIVR
jgi:hypothetical protein